MRRALPLFFLLITLVAGNAFAAKITIVNTDQPGVGFNDRTPAQPVGGNTGATLGEQRMNVFKKAAEIWGNLLQSDVEILIDASFAPNNDCTPTSGVLAFAGPTRIVANFPGAPRQNVWYPIALANKLAGRDLNDTVADIRTSFNSAVGTPSCLTSVPWYLGLDGQHGPATDLLVTVLHELAHGFGMTGVTNSNTGEMTRGMPSVFELYAMDLSTGMRWDQMSPEQRLKSGVNLGNLVWGGESTRHAAADYLRSTITLQVTNGNNPTRNIEVQTATFGPAVRDTIRGKLVAAVDAANTEGPTTADGCTAFSNAAEIRGNIAFVDRGTCTFAQKALNAQAAGATAVVIANDNRDDESCGLPPMGGVDDSVRIPAVGIRRADAEVIRASVQGAGVASALGTDPALKAGSNAGYVRLYAPCTYDPGSSVHHWDTVASPNLLMEPRINGDLPHGVDITLNYLLDIGWGQGGPIGGRRVLNRRPSR